MKGKLLQHKFMSYGLYRTSSGKGLHSAEAGRHRSEPETNSCAEKGNAEFLTPAVIGRYTEAFLCEVFIIDASFFHNLWHHIGQWMC